MRWLWILALASLFGPVLAQNASLVPAHAAINKGDYAQAIDVLKPLAAGGDTEAQFLLATALEQAKPPLGDAQAAYGWYRAAAEQGHLDARTNLGIMYMEGMGVAPDVIEGEKLIRAAAEHGYARAQTHLARMYLDGDGVKQDASEAAKWFERAAHLNYEVAQFYLAVLYQRGLGVERDLERALVWMTRAASRGHRLAMLELARAYENGLGVVASPEKAKEWRDRARSMK